MDSQKNEGQKPTEREVIPGTPVVRGNTPRPFMYNTMSSLPPNHASDEQAATQDQDQDQDQDIRETVSSLSAFPTKPPSAPPLPEEPDIYDEPDENFAVRKAPIITPEAQGFVWLFEYGLEMDGTLLNTPERLDGLALLYGPGVLKGYRLFVGTYESAGSGERTVATIVPDASANAEVWGVLYRVPNTVMQPRGDEPSLAALVHMPPQGYVRAMHVVVQETYRNRTLPCVTYGWPDTTKLRHFSAKNREALDIYVRRLSSIARKQRLPEAYRTQIAQLDVPQTIPDTPIAAPPPPPAPTMRRGAEPPTRVSQSEQQTEPLALPVAKLEKSIRVQDSSPVSQVQRVPIKSHPQSGFIAFTIYLFCLLLAILALAIVQGVGVASDVLNDHFLLLNVPWLVLVYGLLGGCISSLIAMGRIAQPVDTPVFVIVTWFTRPFVGAVLALFAYVLLNSGIFLPANTAPNGQHEAVFLLVGAIAGVCESWLFRRS